VIGDFNLYHPMWCGVQNPTFHQAAEPLAQIMSLHELTLATPKGAVIWEARGATSTIDLAFFSEGLYDRLATCAVRPDIDFGSDHYPVAIELELDSVRIDPPPRCCWKRMDQDKVRAGAEHLLPPAVRG
jgi:endonuclease/exonuclease/phosphatase family metal-dependent hydrolase